MHTQKKAIELTSEEIIELIAKSKKKTIVRAFVSGELSSVGIQQLEGYNSEFEFVGTDKFGVLFGNYEYIKKILEHQDITLSKVEFIAHNSAIPLADISKFNARIEPGAVIREYVEIGNNAVIMMGAIINLGSVIGEGTMIDMNVVVGARARIGKYCHIGAGTVIAGVVEPPSASPVTIEDHVVVGANAVILEGVKVGEHSVVAAGAVVVNDVPPYTVVAGIPARIVKQVDEKTQSKTQILNELRKLNNETD